MSEDQPDDGPDLGSGSTKEALQRKWHREIEGFSRDSERQDRRQLPGVNSWAYIIPSVDIGVHDSIKAASDCDLDQLLLQILHLGIDSAPAGYNSNLVKLIDNYRKKMLELYTKSCEHRRTRTPYNFTSDEPKRSITRSLDSHGKPIGVPLAAAPSDLVNDIGAKLNECLDEVGSTFDSCKRSISGRLSRDLFYDEEISNAIHEKAIDDRVKTAERLGVPVSRVGFPSPEVFRDILRDWIDKSIEEVRQYSGTVQVGEEFKAELD